MLKAARNAARLSREEAAHRLHVGSNVFQNSNGIDYFIVAGTDKRALLRDMDSGYYVISNKEGGQMRRKLIRLLAMLIIREQILRGEGS